MELVEKIFGGQRAKRLMAMLASRILRSNVAVGLRFETKRPKTKTHTQMEPSPVRGGLRLQPLDRHDRSPGAGSEEKSHGVGSPAVAAAGGDPQISSSTLSDSTPAEPKTFTTAGSASTVAAMSSSASSSSSSFGRGTQQQKPPQNFASSLGSVLSAATAAEEAPVTPAMPSTKKKVTVNTELTPILKRLLHPSATTAESAGRRSTNNPLSAMTGEKRLLDKRYDLWWDGVSSMIAVQNQTKLRTNVRDTRGANMTDYERLAALHLIHPNGTLKAMWDILAGCAIFYSVLEVPFTISFMQDIKVTGPALVLDILVITIFFVDLVLTFNTSYVDQYSDKLVTDRRYIAARYAKFWLWVDLVSSIPFDQIAASTDQGQSNSATAVRLVRILRLLRLTRLFKLAKLFQFQRLKQVAIELRVSVAVTNVVILLLQLLVILHLVACFWYFLCTPYATGANNVNTAADDVNPVWLLRTWATTFDFQTASVFSQYVVAQYWSFFTLFGVGFGDIHATNVGERIFSVVVMLLGVIFQGAVISKVSRVIKSTNLLMRAVDEKMAELQVFLTDKKIPTMIKVEAQEAYSYYLQRRPELLEADTFSTLPKSLLYKFISSSFDKEMQQVRFFRLSDIAFISHIITHTIPYHCTTGAVLYDAGDVAEELAFLNKGTVRIVVNNGTHETTCGYATSGGYFGDFEYTARQGIRAAKYEAVQNCTLLALEYNRLRRAMNETPDAGHRFRRELAARHKAFLLVVKAAQEAARLAQEEGLGLRQKTGLTADRVAGGGGGGAEGADGPSKRVGQSSVHHGARIVTVTTTATTRRRWFRT